MPEDNRDTVNIDTAVHSIYKELSEGTDIEASPFKTMKDIFMWSACLGYKIGERKPLSSKTMIFRWAQFSSQEDTPLLKAIAIADSEGLEVLRSQDQILSVIEEYANAGIYELKAQTIDEHGQPLWNLLNNI